MAISPDKDRAIRSLTPHSSPIELGGNKKQIFTSRLRKYPLHVKPLLAFSADVCSPLQTLECAQNPIQMPLLSTRKGRNPVPPSIRDAIFKRYFIMQNMLNYCKNGWHYFFPILYAIVHRIQNSSPCLNRHWRNRSPSMANICFNMQNINSHQSNAALRHNRTRIFVPFHDVPNVLLPHVLPRPVCVCSSSVRLFDDSKRSPP